MHKVIWQVGRTSDSCSMLDYVRVINFCIIIIIIILASQHKRINYLLSAVVSYR